MNTFTTTFTVTDTKLALIETSSCLDGLNRATDTVMGYLRDKAEPEERETVLRLLDLLREEREKVLAQRRALREEERRQQL